MPKSESDPKKDPVFQKVVRKFLDTPPRPKKQKEDDALPKPKGAGKRGRHKRD